MRLAEISFLKERLVDLVDCSICMQDRIVQVEGGRAYVFAV